MAYKLVVYENKTEKRFATLKKKFSKEVWDRMLDFLTTTPEQGKKEMQYRKYNLPDANRILYDILSDEVVRIIDAGNHEHYETQLKKFGKKK